MRHGRSTPATPFVLATAAAVCCGVGLPLACSSAVRVSGSSGSGGGSGHTSSAQAGSSHAAASSSGSGAGGVASATAATTTTTTTAAGGAASASGAGGAPATTTTTATGGASSAVGAGGAGGAGTGGAPETTVTLHPNAPPLPGQSDCTVVEVSNIPEPDFVHLAICTPITYATNPPSGGDHWPIWASYTEYTTPIPRELYVHDLEHGAIVLGYNCASPCPDVVSALDMVFASQVDPLCLAMGGGPIARMVMTPDPLLPTPITASAWGATYTATCIDPPSLLQFVSDHYGNGRESFCTDGVDPSTIVCTDAGADGG